VADVGDDDSEHERKMIVSALVQSRGRISGPRGAAAALGLPPFDIGSSHQEAEYSREPIQAWLVVMRIRHILWFPQFHKIRTPLSAGILLYFQALQNGVLRAFLETCKYSRDACRKGEGMTCKVVRLIDRDCLVQLLISGHLQEAHINMIDDLLTKETDPVALDLGEVILADREAVKFLATLDARGVGLRNCPGFVREWMRKL
jgi:hypothetical protein